MKRIVIFESAIDSLRTFARLMEAELKNLGYPTLLTDMADPVTAREKVLAFAEKKNVAALFLNHAGLNLLTETRESIWNVLEADCYNLIVDHPMYYHEAIIFPIKKLTILCVDQNHVDFINRFYPGRVRSIFFPHGGIKAEENEVSFENRTMDVLFTGAYLIDDNIEIHTESLGAGMKEIWLECFSLLNQKTHLTLEHALETCFQKRGVFLETEDLRDAVRLFQDMDGMLRSRMRARVVKVLADHDVRVHVYGEGWQFLDCKKENLILHDRVPFDETIPLTAHAKIVLNVMPWFKAGAHDRIYTAMLNRSVCVTDSSKYIEETLTDEENILLFSLDHLEELPPKVKFYLQHADEWKRVSENGYLYADHTQEWKNRAVYLAQIFEQ